MKNNRVVLLRTKLKKLFTCAVILRYLFRIIDVLASHKKGTKYSMSTHFSFNIEKDSEIFSHFQFKFLVTCAFVTVDDEFRRDHRNSL